jgi:hypothetical protein
MLFVLILCPALGGAQSSAPSRSPDTKDPVDAPDRASIGPLRLTSASPRKWARAGAGALHCVQPCRFLDTRDAETLWYETPGPFQHGRCRFYVVQNSCGVPLGATGVVLNVTVAGATAPGHLILGTTR